MSRVGKMVVQLERCSPSGDFSFLPSAPVPFKYTRPQLRNNRAPKSMKEQESGRQPSAQCQARSSVAPTPRASDKAIRLTHAGAAELPSPLSSTFVVPREW
jgi:hypothetical protein